MPSRRKLIELDADEVRDYLDEEKTLIIVGNGHNGYPHPMPMWFAQDPDGSIRCTTFGKSQKVLNWRRDPKATLLVESGVEYAELKGVMIYAHCEVIDDTDAVKDTLVAINSLGRRPRRRRKGQATRSSLGHGSEAGRAKVHPEALRHLGPRQAGWSLLTGITYRRPTYGYLHHLLHFLRLQTQSGQFGCKDQGCSRRRDLHHRGRGRHLRRQRRRQARLLEARNRGVPGRGRPRPGNAGALTTPRGGHNGPPRCVAFRSSRAPSARGSGAGAETCGSFRPGRPSRTRAYSSGGP